MKLVNKIEKGIFINKKLYAIKNSNKLTIIKASGTDSKSLTWNDFESLLKGMSVKSKRITFDVDWKALKVSTANRTIIIKGLNKGDKID